MKVSFGKNIEYKNDQWIYHPFFISVSEFHDLYTLPGSYDKQQTHECMIKILLFDKTRSNIVDQLSSQRSGTKNNDSYIDYT